MGFIHKYGVGQKEKNKSLAL